MATAEATGEHMLGDNIILAVFTGTGNTLVAAEHLARRLADAGKKVRLIPMEKPALLGAAGFDTNAKGGNLRRRSCRGQ